MVTNGGKPKQCRGTLPWGEGAPALWKPLLSGGLLLLFFASSGPRSFTQPPFISKNGLRGEL